MRQLSQKDLVKAVESALGGAVPYVDGVRIESFNMMELAAVIEGEAERVKNGPSPKIVLHLDLPDALDLAKALRKLALL